MARAESDNDTPRARTKHGTQPEGTPGTGQAREAQPPAGEEPQSAQRGQDHHAAREAQGGGEGSRGARVEKEQNDDQPAVKVVDRRWWARPAEGPEDETWQMQRPSYVEELERQLAEKDRHLQETVAKYRAAAQEFDQVRVRLRRDVVKEIERGRRTMLLELLDVVDNLDRAVDAARESMDSADSPVASLLSGVEMVRTQFLAKLDGFGAKLMSPAGQPFDPTKHEAVTVVPTGDPASDGIVAGVVRQGYMVGDEVLRPALVAVMRADGAAGADTAGSAGSPAS